jgi:predicted dehydrogenase
VLRQGERRVILHAGMLVAHPAPRFAIHGAKGSLVKRGLDPQEDALKAGQRPPRAGWGLDPQPCELRVWRKDRTETRQVSCEPGNYPAFYAAVRDAISGTAPNPVTPEEAMRVMALLDLGRQSAIERREIRVDATFILD